MVELLTASSKQFGWFDHSQKRYGWGSCRNVGGTIIKSEEKMDNVDYLVYCKRTVVFWIYISSNIGVCTLYSADSPNIELTRCGL